MTAIRPPEYFPRLSYMALLLAADSGVLADTFQYSRQSFQNRMRIRTPQGRHWLSVPLKGGQHGRPICEVEIDRRVNWQRTHWRSLVYNYSSAPFFQFYDREVHELLHEEWHTLGELTCASVELLCRLLGVETLLRRASALPGAPADLEGVAHSVHDGTLLALPDTASHDARLVGNVRVLAYSERVRHQNFPGFEAGLSALDLLFNYGPEARSILQEGTSVADDVGA
ncbi:MAG TPA: WbqC family protein [Rhodothermales bacterium]|nr:WbqC family protein [Rhodothermales bacterium]